MKSRDQIGFGPEMDLVLSLFAVSLIAGLLVWFRTQPSPKPEPPKQAKSESDFEGKILKDSAFEVGEDQLTDVGKRELLSFLPGFREQLMEGNKHLEIVGHASPELRYYAERTARGTSPGLTPLLVVPAPQPGLPKCTDKLMSLGLHYNYSFRTPDLAR